MKIVLIQHKDFINGTGGTEKICVFLANGFASSGYEVEIATNENLEGGAMFELHPKVSLVNIYNNNNQQKKLQTVFNYKGHNPLLWLRYKVQKKYTKARNRRLENENGGKENFYLMNLKERANEWNAYINTSQPDLIITMTIASLLEITYEQNLTVPLLNSTNGRPDHDFTDVLWYRSEIEMRLLKDSYKHLSAIQILFESYESYLPNNFTGICETIPNPILGVKEKEVVVHTEKKRYKIIHLGRLACSHKQQHMLINAFAKIANAYPDWDLEFWGEGEDESRLIKQINKRKLQSRVFLRGFTNNPAAQLKNADIFGFPSRHEGFPLGLAEAMYLGLPSVGLADCCGVNEMIEHNVSGYLAKNEADLSTYLEDLMRDRNKRFRFGQQAHQAMKDYDFDYVFNKWKALVQKMLS